VPDFHIPVRPHARDVLLIGGAGIAVVHVDIGVDGRRQARDLDPGDQGTCGRVVAFDLVTQLGDTVGRGEGDVKPIAPGVRLKVQV